MQAGDRVCRLGPSDSRRRGHGKAQEAVLAGGDRLGRGADRLLDRLPRIDPVLIVEVDMVNPEPLERCVSGMPDILGVAPGPEPAHRSRP